MRLLPMVLVFSLVAGLTACAWGAVPPGGPTATPPAGDPPTSGPSPASARIEKQIADIEQKLAATVEDEYNLTQSLMKAQEKANKFASDPTKAAAEIAAGRLTPELRQYKAVFLAYAQQVQAFDAKLVGLLRTVKAIQRDRATASLQQRLAALEEQVQAKRRSALDKLADTYMKAGESKTAIGIYAAIYQALPEDKRATEGKAIKEKVAAVYEKAGDFKNAAAVNREVYDAIPEAHRSENISLMLKLGSLYERIGDSKNALQIYKDAQKYRPANMTINGLDESIARCEKKVDSSERTGSKTR